MKPRISKAISRSRFSDIEQLESRRLLTATVVSQIPAQSLSTSQTSATVDLGTYFNDPTIPAGDTVVDIKTDISAPYDHIPIELTDTATPITVANFLKYISTGEYANTIIHRSEPNFVIQGGGYTTNAQHIAIFGAINGESSTATLKNTTGTIAMALSNGPNSGTSEWFFNLANNSNLDNASDGGPFTAFGQVVYSGLSVVNAIGTLPTVNDSSANGAWTNLPLLNYNSSAGTGQYVLLNPAVVTDGLNFTATSSDDSIVTSAISNGSLTLTRKSGGSATITVTATDLGGTAVMSTFTVSSASAVVLPVSTTTTLTESQSTISQNGADTFTATVTRTSVGSTLTGSVDFEVGGASIGTANIADGSASLTSNFSAVGDQSVTAIYSGDTNYTSSTSSAITLTVLAPAPSTTQTVLQASKTTADLNGTDTFTAVITPTVSGVALTGTVDFEVGGVSIGTADLVDNSAVLIPSFAVSGDQAVTAIYSGDANYVTSTSNTVTISVATAPTLAPAVSRTTLATNVVSGTAVKGTVFVGVDNVTSATIKGIFYVDVYASADGSVDADSILIASVKKNMPIKAGKTAIVPVPIKTIPASLSAGSYDLISQTVDVSHNMSTADTGPAVVVAAPFISLSEAFTKFNLPTTAIAGAKTPAAAVLSVTNSGNIPSVGMTIISLYATPDGTIASGTVLKTVTQKRLTIKAGKSAVIHMPLGKIPSLAAGTYSIVAQVTDPNGQVSTVTFGSTIIITA